VKFGPPAFTFSSGRVLKEAGMRPVPVSLAELTARYRDGIVGYLVRLLGDRQEAEDACQDAFLRAHRAFARLAPEANSRAWLYRIATRSGLNAARRRARRTARAADVDLDSLPAAAGLSPERREELLAIRRAVDRLPPRQRAALMLRQFEGFGYAEIAVALGGSQQGARANVYQAIKKLRATLGGARRRDAKR